jgi:hypothetical protein
MQPMFGRFETMQHMAPSLTSRNGTSKLVCIATNKLFDDYMSEPGILNNSNAQMGCFGVDYNAIHRLHRETRALDRISAGPIKRSY